MPDSSIPIHFRPSRQDLLWVLPTALLLVSYAYICWYHQIWHPVTTVVHEGGKLTLWETALYASHFLGHVPVVTVVAFWFVGSWRSLSDCREAPSHWRPWALGLALFLLASAILSWAVFGARDTLDFLLQRKQSEAVFGQGGSWNLHLPSTMLLYFLIPAFVFAGRRLTGASVSRSSSGRRWLVAGWMLVLAMTFLVNGLSIDALARIWASPRYLAHSVRELLTFPALYFGPALYLLSRRARKAEPTKSFGWTLREKIGLSIFILGAALQSVIALNAGIGQLAQKPSFARGGTLGVPYLLSVHYFEHMLDAAYFVLLCSFLAAFSCRRSATPDRSRFGD